MNPSKKLTSQEKTHHQQELSAETQAQTQGQIEFQSVEDLLRHDALHTPVPASIADRLQQSLEQNPPPPRSWWRRLFGG